MLTINRARKTCGRIGILTLLVLAGGLASPTTAFAGNKIRIIVSNARMTAANGTFSADFKVTGYARDQYEVTITADNAVNTQGADTDPDQFSGSTSMSISKPGTITGSLINELKDGKVTLKAVLRVGPPGRPRKVYRDTAALTVKGWESVVSLSISGSANARAVDADHGNWTSKLNVVFKMDTRYCAVSASEVTIDISGVAVGCAGAAFNAQESGATYLSRNYSTSGTYDPHNPCSFNWTVKVTVGGGAEVAREIAPCQIN